MVTAQQPGRQGVFFLYRHAKQPLDSHGPPGTWEWEEGLSEGRGGVDSVERIQSFTNAAQFQAPSSGV